MRAALGAAISASVGLLGCAREDVASVVVSGAGFSTPACVVHDPEADVYLVSNVHGDPCAKDDNGFVSRVAPDGSVLELRWIDGADDGLELHAPKGMALLGDRLFVADIDAVRVFDARTGEPRSEVRIEGATFLHGVTVGPGAAVHVTDSGFSAGLSATGTDAIYRIDSDLAVTTVARSSALEHPGGIGATDRDLFFVTCQSGRFAILPPGGEPAMLVELPSAMLVGLVRAGQGRWLVSSQAGGCVYALDPKGEARTVVRDLDGPAGLGWDATRSRALIPLSDNDSLRFERLAG
jgi:hypothetical protein